MCIWIIYLRNVFQLFCFHCLPAGRGFPNNPVSSIWTVQGRPNQMSQSWCNRSQGSFPLLHICTPLDTACNKRECVKLSGNHLSPCLHCMLITMQKHTVYRHFSILILFNIWPFYYLQNKLTLLHWLIHKAMDPVCLGGYNTNLVKGKEGKSQFCFQWS